MEYLLEIQIYFVYMQETKEIVLLDYLLQLQISMYMLEINISLYMYMEGKTKEEEGGR